MTADPVYRLGCGAIFGYNHDIPTPNACVNCPPKRCPDCGEMDHITNLCSCWKSMDDDSPADIKAMFADWGLNVTTTKETR